MAIQNQGYSGVIQEVDANRAAYSRLRDVNGNDLSVGGATKLNANQGGVIISGVAENTSKLLRTDALGNLGTMAAAQLQFFELFDGTTINTQRWVQAVSGFAQTQAAKQFNFGAVTTAGAYSILSTNRVFSKIPRVPLQFRARVRLSIPANSGADLGFGLPTTNTVIVTNSAHWRIAANNSAVPVLTNGGTEVLGSTVDLSAYTAAYLTFDVIVDDLFVIYRVIDSQTNALISEQIVKVQSGWSDVWAVAKLQAFARIYNLGVSPSVSPVGVIGAVEVIAHDVSLLVPYQHLLALNHYAARINQALSQTANFANSAAPASATLSNTAAGYALLGGQWQFAAVAGAETDYLLFGYTVGAGYQLVVEGIRIDSFNMGAAVATTPTLLQWGIGGNGSAANLNTGGFIREAVGTQSFAVGAAIGARADNVIDTNFPTPVVTESGKNFAVILKIPVGTATASQIIRGTCQVRGYFVA